MAPQMTARSARRLYPFRPLLRRLIARGGMRWYKLSDFNAELEAFLACLARRVDIVHFLDGEHSGAVSSTHAGHGADVRA